MASGDVTPAKKKGMRPPGTTTYPQHIIDQALLAMAYTRQAKAAWEELKLAGVSPLPSQSTLRAWRHTYSNRLAELTEQHGADIDRHIKARYMDIMDAGIELTMKILAKTAEAVENGEITGKDLPSAAKSVTWVFAVTQDKKFLLEGKPTSIVGREKDAEETLRSLANRFAVDSEAKEEEPKELES